MASKQFIEYVERELLSLSNEYGFKDNRRAFEPWALQYIMGIDRFNAVNNTDTLEQGDEGLDGWVYDSDDNIFHLFQMKFPDDVHSTYDGKACDELIKFHNKLIDRDHNFRNSKLRNIHDEYWKVHNPDLKIKLNIVVFSNFSITTAENIERDVSMLDDSTTVEIYDIEKLFSMYVDENDLSDLSGQKIEFEIHNGQFLEIESINEETIGKAAVVTLVAINFAQIVKDNYPNIVSKNVRFHLGKSKNKGMIELLNNQDENYKFWYYNNGLTIICKDWDIKDGKIIIDNPQIINGGQTSKTLSEHINSLNNDVFVLAKIIKLGNDSVIGKEEGLKISETSNTQNKVTLSDLKALCPIQKSIKASFYALDPKWYYEIKNKEWNVLTPAERRRYGTRKLNKTDIGQEWRMVNINPIDAISKKDEMYYDSSLYNRVFSADRDVLEYLYAHNIVMFFTNLLSLDNLTILQAYDKSLDKNILSRILNAKKLAVGYLSYLLNHVIKKELSPIDYQEIINLLENNPDYFKKALKLLFIAYRKFIVGIDINESLLNKLRDHDSLQEATQEFLDLYDTTVDMTGTKLFD